MGLVLAGRGGLIARVALLAALALALTAPSASAAEFQARIYYGGEASEGEYPHQAFVSSTIGSCGGTLITRTEVVTAAHCTDGLELVPEDFEVFLGSRNIGQGTSSQPGQANVYGVAAVDQHDSFSPVTLENDVSILTLEEAVPYRPLRLIGTGETALWDATGGDMATIIGWGEREDGTFPSILHEAQVPMISDAACDGHYEDPPPPEEYYPATMVCAGNGTSANPESDTCRGDSGGPLMVHDGTAFALIGATSWGEEECGEGPGVYARIGSDPLNDWVAARMTSGPPDNDAFATPFELRSSDSEFGHFNGDATKEAPDEPVHAGNSGGKSLWYSWTSGSTGQATIDACTATFDTLVGVYTGSDLASLAPVASNDDGCTSGSGSRTQFAAQQGQSYVFAVDGKDDSGGTFNLHVSVVPSGGGNGGGGNPGGGGTGGGSTTQTPSGPSQRVATRGNDDLFGTSQDDFICGLGGSDLIRGFAGNDTLFGDRCGASGARASASGDGGDRLFGDSGNDRLFGSGRADRLSGGSGNDRLVGGRGRDVLSGAGGRDLINSRDGARDIVNCGPGRDTVRRDRRDRVRGCERVRR
jgi:secreted trypsin-like serine protease